MEIHCDGDLDLLLQVTKPEKLRVELNGIRGHRQLTIDTAGAVKQIQIPVGEVSQKLVVNLSVAEDGVSFYRGFE